MQGPTTAIDGIRPDINRIKQPLEQYEIAQLTFRGVVVSPEGQEYALVQRPDGSVASVKVGDYLGLNDGRIVEITPTQINLIEIVPDSRTGFIERPQSLVSPIN
jgi:type IV pilus assembly protein PilP